jgi:hypothetical protein
MGTEMLQGIQINLEHLVQKCLVNPGQETEQSKDGE